MSSASSVVTYTSVYTDFEPGRVFWGADEELLNGVSSRVIVYGYNGLPMQPPHDPDYVPEPMYPEYIPLEDEHVLPVEEQPLPPVDTPTTESPGYVAESDPEEDPKEYENDETEDGPVDYLMDGGDDGDNDESDSFGDDADDEDEDEEYEEEEEEHLASADSAVVIPTVELVSPSEGTEPAAISLPPNADVQRLLAMPTPPPSPLTSLSPPSARERLTRCTAPSAHSSPPPVPSPLLPSSGCPTQIQTLRMASTQALIDAVTAALPSPPLPPPLYIPPPVDHNDDIPETEMPPRTLDADARRRGIREVGYSIRDTWVDPAEAVPEIAPMTLGENSHITMSHYGLAAGRLAYGGYDSPSGDHTDCRGGGLCCICTRVSAPGTPDTATVTRRQAQLVKTLRVTGDMRREMGDMQTELLALREQPRRARQLVEDARVPDHQDAPRDADSHI
nr:hypothetical protein [Tanacetum cinerariifolium]